MDKRWLFLDKNCMPRQLSINQIADESWTGPNKLDCSGYVRAVASAVGVMISVMQASPMIKWMNSASGWLQLGSDQLKASQMSARGYLVIGGLAEKPPHHGHVVVIVPGWSNTLHPLGYWGSIVGLKFAHANASISLAWTALALPNVTFYAIKSIKLSAVYGVK